MVGHDQITATGIFRVGFGEFATDGSGLFGNTIVALKLEVHMFAVEIIAVIQVNKVKKQSIAQ